MTRIFFILTVFLTVTVAKVFGQTEMKNKRFDNFIKQFPATNLPDTIQYSVIEFDYGYYEPDDEQGDVDSANSRRVIDTTQEYQNSVLPKPDSLIITYELVKSFLLADAEKPTVYWAQDSPDTIHPIYYFTKKFLTNKNFYCVVYERQFYFNGNPYCQKYLCTLTKNGKFIDKIKVASADYSGTGILGDGFRVPWFPDEKSVINQDLKILYFKEGLQFITVAGSGKVELFPDNIYQIDNNANIKKIK